ncbi:MAG: TM0106 family RecB-like putative nuclease [Solirubrobacteraceae bacterium]|nr:TM0106 family RecB-like putative nuclease [Solirubrobacteraceae bacterium]
MLKLSDGQIVLSATDLTNHLACGHLTQQRLGVVRGERKRPQKSESAHADLLRERGDAHEKAELDKLTEGAGGDWVELPSVRRYDAAGKYLPPTAELLKEAAEATRAAMHAGTKLLFQASFFDGRWQGATDFLRRVDLTDAPDDRTRQLIQDSKLGGYAYEVLDTKLSKVVKPHVVHQLLIYSRLVGRIQGVELPIAWVILGNGQHEPVDLTQYGALHRRVVRRFEAVTEAATVETYPEPVAHCPICSLSGECDARLRADDHLSLIANARRGQRQQLVELGLPTVASLAGVAADVDAGLLAETVAVSPGASGPGTQAPSSTLTPESPPMLTPESRRTLTAESLRSLGAERFETLRSQAALQVQSRTSGVPVRKILEPTRRAGLALLPEPSDGDIFFDLEGDPYVGESGIEYLWGWSRTGAGGAYDCRWAHDEAGERAALEAFVDHVLEQRKIHPGLHVFHYAPHERSKLLELSTKHATREREVDTLVRSGVLVDLYAVVGRALQVGEESYSLKKLERHHAFERLERSVREGGGSIVAYEAWLEDPTADELLESIRAYNEEDCRSTWSLRDWLQGVILPEAQAQWPDVDWAELRAPEDEDEVPEPAWIADVQRVAERLHEGLPEEPADDPPEQAERRLAGDLLFYLRREQKPEWWRYFELLAADPIRLIDEREALGGLQLDKTVEPVSPGKGSRSLDYTFSFPPQDFKQPMTTIDPVTEKGVNLVRVDIGASRAVIRRVKTAADDPFPASIVPGVPVDATEQRRALEALADVILGGFGKCASPPGKGKAASDAASAIWRPEPQPHGRFAAVRALLRREPPRLTGDAALGESTEQLVAATLALDHSVLPVQGPPGTGKTYNAARMIVAALKAKKRVGISAQSHAGITNLLRAVERHAVDIGFTFTGAYRGDPDNYTSASGCVIVEETNDPIDKDLPQLVAGTAWFFARELHRRPEPSFDLIFIDEAGQFSLAQACAVGTSTHNLVLLGDPQQLPQVTQADHPHGSGASVLEHILNGHPTVPEGRGVLLTQTWRMHPAICDFVSEHSYEGKLHAQEDCARREVRAGGDLTGAGIRTIEVEHQGNSQWSQEEADAIASACRDLLDGGTVTEPLRDAPEVIARAVVASRPLPPNVTHDDGMITRPLAPRDILVVAPYNLAVQRIASAVPKGVRVGTVDKIQGQEAPVVFYALTCSTAEDVPRGLDFLFDANRLNVAISRAQSLAVLVHSPQLLDAHCRTLEAMQLVDGACSLVDAETTA